MTYSAPSNPNVMPILLANVQSAAEQQQAINRGWLGGFHTTIIDQAWVDELDVASRFGFVTFISSDFTGAALSAAGQTKAALIEAEQTKFRGVDIDYSDQAVIPVVEAAVETVPVYWKNATQPTTHKCWSREWFWLNNTQGTTNMSVDFDPETDTLDELSTFMREGADRKYAAYCQAKGKAMENTASTGSGELVRPGMMHMFKQLLFCHTQRAAAAIMDGWRDYDGVTWETKITSPDAEAQGHFNQMVKAYAMMKLPGSNGENVFEFHDNAVPRPNVGVVS